MTSEVEERPRLIMGGYGQHRRQWVKKPVGEKTLGFLLREDC